MMAILFFLVKDPRKHPHPNPLPVPSGDASQGEGVKEIP
jgi:hypothetical protein